MCIDLGGHVAVRMLRLNGGSLLHSAQRGNHAQARPYKLDTAKVAAMRRQYVAPNHAIMYKEPLHIVRGKGAWLFDNDGNAYLDCVNNVAHVGHSNAKVRVYSRPRSV